MLLTSKRFYEFAVWSSNYYVIFSRDLVHYIPGSDIDFYEFKIDETRRYMVHYTDYTVQLKNKFYTNRIVLICVYFNLYTYTETV